jgi:hypothetical protein
MEDVRLSLSSGALEAIAKKAIARKTGARGLRSILEAILLDTMFDRRHWKGSRRWWSTVKWRRDVPSPCRSIRPPGRRRIERFLMPWRRGQTFPLTVLPPGTISETAPSSRAALCGRQNGA